MGWNTSAVIMNDALHDIAKDKDIGEKIMRAAQTLHGRGEPVDISAMNHCNAITLIETHHADSLIPILVGGNSGKLLPGTGLHWNVSEEEFEVTLLLQLANRHGFHLRKKPKK